MTVTYPNGKIPLSALTAVEPFGYLRHDAAVAYTAMRAAAARDGVDLRPAGPDLSCYRDYAGQVQMRNLWCGRGQCDHAAIPGTSNHGLGVAVDFLMDTAGRVYAWMSANAGRFGFTHTEGARIGEAWHWGYTGTYVAPRDPRWFLTARERRLVTEFNHLRATGADPKRRKVVWRWLRDQRGRIYHVAMADGGWDSAKSKAAHRHARWTALRKITS